jgi:hypothetical protein
VNIAVWASALRFSSPSLRRKTRLLKKGGPRADYTTLALESGYSLRMLHLTDAAH